MKTNASGKKCVIGKGYPLFKARY